MTILRQSFESLRVKGAETADGRAKPSTPTVNAAGAASEPKSAQGEQASRASKGMTRPQTAKMLERVESTLKEAARSRDGRTISLHLEPVNLGKVKVDVSLREGTLHARIAPENQQVVQALREHAHELQSSLRKLGLDVDSVSVSITSESFSGEMATGEQMMNGRSFQEERNNLPDRRAQVPENTLGNELADWSRAGADTQGSATGKVLDHWVA
jgi:flagellar hook-length control protein FliK